MAKIISKAYTFDDLLLKPAYSEVLPREVEVKTSIGKNLELKIPLFSAAMDTVTETKMAMEIAKLGGMGIIHKNMSITKQAQMVQVLREKSLQMGAALSTDEMTFLRAEALVKAGVSLLVLDTAHGHSLLVIKTLKKLRKLYPELTLVAGNVATEEGADALFQAGADIVKVGIGPGSICTTRVVSGVGVPQLSAILECAKSARKHHKEIIADGGIKYSGDLTKALAAGAHAVMLGSLFSGSEETPGEIVEINHEKRKVYRGMGSLEAMTEGDGSRYFQNKVKKFIPEGIKATVPYKGPVKDIIYQLIGGLKSGMGYCGAINLKELREKSQFLEISAAGRIESHPHSVKKFEGSSNVKK